MYNFCVKKPSVVYAETFAPDQAPAWVLDPILLAQAIDTCETRRDAQLLRSIDFSLPIELTREQQIALARDIAKDYERNHGMIAMLFVHDEGQGNPHAHLLLPMRPLNPDGSWGAKSHQVPILDGKGNKIKLPNGNYKSFKVYTTDWNDRGNVEKWREQWATHTNTYLERHGHSAHVYHKSHKRRGLEELPTVPLGSIGHHREQRGIRTKRGDYNRWVQAYNQRLQSERLGLRQRLLTLLDQIHTTSKIRTAECQKEPAFYHLRPQEDHGNRYEYLCQQAALRQFEQIREKNTIKPRSYEREPRKLLETAFAHPERRKHSEEMMHYQLIQEQSAYLQSHGDGQVSYHQSQRRQVRDYAPANEKLPPTHERPSRECDIHTRERSP